MTDEELAAFMGLSGCSPADRAKVMALITPEKRAAYERMADVETEIALWQAGVGPKPKGMILCHEHKHRRSRP